MKPLFSILILLFSISGHAQEYSKVRIDISDSETMHRLHELPIAADHGTRRPGAYFETDLHRSEIEELRNAEIPFEIIIEDVQKFYRERSADSDTQKGGRSSACDETEISVPSGFALGSMAGFFTYEEFIGHIDNMATSYPNLITVKQPVGNFQTWEGRPIYWLKISDNPNQDETEPEVLYTALHHAREPASLSQLIFYMYYVLENYGTDSEITELVNNTEMYFVPMLNPDGYVRNQTQDPNGGGLWRKNRRNNGDGTYGVDLNRNYGYEWGGTGASANSSASTYRGPQPMSEPEVQAMEWFAQEHDFVTAFNYHSYADMVLFPWGYTDNFQCADHDAFLAISEEMVRENNYLNQQSSLLYPAAGDSDDWGYGETSTKPKIYSMTPEVGGDSDGFWPSQSRIIPLCQENVYMNLTLARSASNFGVATDLQPAIINQSSGHFGYEIQRMGWQSGDFTVSIEPITGIANVGSPNMHVGLDVAETELDSVSYTLTTGIENGDPIIYVLQLDNGLYIHSDTIEKIFGNVAPVFANSGLPTSDWTGGNDWSLTSQEFYTANSSWTDSPNGDYPAYSNATMTTENPIDLAGFSNAFLTFYAKWEIEAGWDYAQVSASTDGSSWIPLCGNYTVLGNDNQDEDRPLYDGTQSDWIREEINLSDFLGESVYLQFKLISDQYVERDGIYIDDIEVIGIPSINVGVDNPTVKRYSVYPNPSTGEFVLKGPKTGASWSVTDAIGRVVTSGISSSANNGINLNNQADGVYFLTVITGEGIFTDKLILNR